MGVMENIISAVMILMLLLISGLVYFASYAQDSATNLDLKKDIFLDDSRINDFATILKITEPVSGRSMGVLMADAVYYRTTMLEFDDQVINVTEKVDTLLDMSMNSDYYLEIKPRFIEVSMNFIIDGSDSLSEERETLAQNIKGIVMSIEGKLNKSSNSQRPVVANIFILGSKIEKCANFNALADSRIRCHILNDDDLYLKDRVANTSDHFINNSRFDIDRYHNYYNMSPPFGYSWLDADAQHHAGVSDYYESDWGYGLGYASYSDDKTSLSRLTLLFPMGDELSTSSISDECFEKTQYPEWIECSLCNSECPAERSMRSIQKGLEIALDNSHVINPIFSYTCDYDYKSLFNELYREVHDLPIAPAHACDESQCGGCTLNNSNVCFHPSCNEIITQQMQYLADETGGETINLDEIATMDINITNTIKNNMEHYAIEIGEKHPDRERDVIETTQPLPNGQLVDIRLWVYENEV